jgi:Type II secretory pathway, pullulanase PulA and related glycosidases
MIDIKSFEVGKGLPYPLGATALDGAVNFALVSAHATSVSLCLYDRESEKLLEEIQLSPQTNRTGNVWHISVKNIKSNIVYAYRILPKLQSDQDLLLDPYAKCTSTSNIWGKNVTLPGALRNAYQPLGELILNNDFDWENDSPPHIQMNHLIIYEMHVRAFTKDPSSGVSNPGTFLGLIEKIPHLLELGVNAVELLPVQEFNELEYLQSHKTDKKNLYNFWGYSTVNFFCPDE